MQQSGTEKASKPSSKWTAANYTGKFAFLLLVFMIGALVNFVNEKFAREGPRTDFATGNSERDKTKVTAKFKMTLRACAFLPILLFFTKLSLSEVGRVQHAKNVIDIGEFHSAV